MNSNHSRNTKTFSCKFNSLLIYLASSQTAKFRVSMGAIKPTVTTSRRLSSGNGATPSGTHFGFPTVDSLLISLNSLVVVPVGGTNHQITIQTYSPPLVVDVANIDTLANLGEDIAIPLGSYDDLKVYFSNIYTAKAYCKTKSSLVYTTSGGVKAVALSSNNTLPEDYAPYTFDYQDYSTTMYAYGNQNPRKKEKAVQKLAALHSSTPDLLFSKTSFPSCATRYVFSETAAILGTPLVISSNQTGYYDIDILVDPSFILAW